MGESLLYSLSAITIAVFVPTALCVFSVRYQPVWVSEGTLSSKWKSLNVLALSLSVLLIISVWFLYSDFNTEYTFMAALSVGTMSFIMVQTFATDFVMRLADRRVLRIANLVSGIAGLWFLISYTDKVIVLLYVLFFLFFCVLLFVPKLGQSDARALQLVLLSSMPVIGLEGFQIGFLLVAVFVVSYGIVKSLKDNGNLSGMLTKMSTPLVPLIIAPFVVMVIIFPFIPA